MAFASQKVLWSVPQTGLCIGLTVSCGFLGKWLLLQKRFCGGFRQLFFTFTSQSPPGVKVAWIVNMSHPYKSSPRKMTHHVVAVGVFFGLLTFFTVIFVAFCAYPHAAWDFQAGPYQKKTETAPISKLCGYLLQQNTVICDALRAVQPQFAAIVSDKSRYKNTADTNLIFTQNCKCSRHGERPVFVRAPSMATA